VLARKFSLGSMAAGFVYLIGVILTFFLANMSHLMRDQGLTYFLMNNYSPG
jgi:hypothetical protein